MKYLTIIPILIYLILVWYKYGIQKSISESYYRLSNKEKPLFFIILTWTAMSIIVGYLSTHNNDLPNILLFLAGAGICYSAAAAGFKDGKITGTVHYIGALLGYFFGYMFIGSLNLTYILTFIVPSLLIMWLITSLEDKKEKSTPGYISKALWWNEITGMVLIWLVTII